MMYISEVTVVGHVQKTRLFRQSLSILASLHQVSSVKRSQCLCAVIDQTMSTLSCNNWCSHSGHQGGICMPFLLEGLHRCVAPVSQYWATIVQCRSH